MESMHNDNVLLKTENYMNVKKFEDLKVWQLANKLSLEVSQLVKTFPGNEKYDLASQMHRSARSVPSEISEGFYRFHFNDKLTFYERARASLGELRNHFGDALAHKYIDIKQHRHFKIKMQEIGYLLNRMMTNVRKARDKNDTQAV
ncbi:MAG TPA: four helix bundle protein [bacterium]